MQVSRDAQTGKADNLMLKSFMHYRQMLQEIYIEIISYNGS